MKNADGVELLTVDEVMAKTGLSRQQVCNLARQGRIEGAERLGQVWLVPKSSIPELLKERKPTGRPRGRPSKKKTTN
jgi:predicted DNA-binding transcriptional regulator AlpA